MSGCDDPVGGGDSGGDGSDGDGSGGGGSDGDDDGYEDEDIIFTLSCDSLVTRGGQAGCEVTVESEEGIGPARNQFIYEWASTTGATQSGSFSNSWSGIATESATISVAVLNEGFSSSGTITVKPRAGWQIDPLSASIDYDDSLPTLGVHEISITPTTVSSPTSGTVPWEGIEMSSAAPSVEKSITIHGDLSSSGPRYRGANKICDA